MEEKNYTLLNGEQDAIIAPEKEVFKCSIEEFECLWVKKEEFLKNGQKTFEDYDEAQEYYPDTVFYGYSDIKPEPREGEYVCVYCSDGEAGDDPYFWDYDSYCHQWWDGSNWKTFTSDDIEELEIVNTITKNEPDFNCGRAVHYHIFKNKSDEYIVGFENDGYFHPISEEKRFTDKAKAIEYIENLIA